MSNKPRVAATLTTPRLTLRNLQLDDYPAFHAIYSDQRTMLYWSDQPVGSEEETRGRVREDVEAANNGSMMFWAIEMDGLVLGKCTLFQFSEQNQRAEIGYLLNREYWGQGIMFEAMSEVVRHCFEDLNLHRLEADADKDNDGSLNLLYKLGFKKEGYFPERWNVYGEWQDSVMLGLLKQNWKKSVTKAD